MRREKFIKNAGIMGKLSTVAILFLVLFVTFIPDHAGSEIPRPIDGGDTVKLISFVAVMASLIVFSALMLGPPYNVIIAAGLTLILITILLPY